MGEKVDSHTHVILNILKCFPISESNVFKLKLAKMK